ncbi:hypothetical protein N2152v2_003886 [Parachlorella kessleri]
MVQPGKAGANLEPAEGPMAASLRQYQDHIATSVPDAPITSQRRPPESLEKYLQSPGTPRANLACSKEHPNGLHSPPANLTVLQQHCKFWDEDDDNVVWPSDTYRGFCRLGFSRLFSLYSALVIHLALSWLSLDGWLPHPGLPIYLKNIHRGKHGSDSGVYDTEGRYVPQHFEEMFSKYSSTGWGLTLGELWSFTQGQWNTGDVVGWFAVKGEWLLTYYIAAKDTAEGRMLMKDDALGVFDGTLFYRVEAEVEAQRLRRQKRGVVKKQL